MKRAPVPVGAPFLVCTFPPSLPVAAVVTAAAARAGSAALLPILAALLALPAGEAAAQTAAVCSNTPGTGERVECEQPAGSTTPIDIDLNGAVIRTTEEDADGVKAVHRGSAAIDIDLGGATVETQGYSADGVRAAHYNAGDLDIDIDVADTSITTRDASSYGVFGIRSGGVGDVRVSLRDAVILIEDSGGGVEVQHQGDLDPMTGSADGDIVIDARGGSVTTRSTRSTGFHGQHLGNGDIRIGLRGVAVSSAGYGVFADHQGHGDATVDVRGGSIEATGVDSYGIFGWHTPSGAPGEDNSGNLIIRVKDALIETTSTEVSDDYRVTASHGIFGQHDGEGDIAIGLEGAVIETAGSRSYGVRAYHSGDGDIDIDTVDTTIETAGDYAFGIAGEHVSTGGIDIDVTGGRIKTAGTRGHGIFSWHQSDGDIDIDTVDANIETAGDYAFGAFVQHDSTGGIDIGMTGGRIKTSGAGAHGVFSWHQGGGGIDIDLTGGRIETSGANANGVYAWVGSAGYAYADSGGRIGILVEGGSIRAAGAGASGIRIGRLNADAGDTVQDGAVEYAAGDADGDGVRDQTVRVNGRVRGGSGDGAGVWLAGGGRVIIGPQGSVGAKSGVAILGAGLADNQEVGDPGLLLVSLNLDGRRFGEAVQGEIRNDAGEIAIAINGMELPGPGADTGFRVPNGAWDIGRKAGATGFGPEDFVESYAPRAAVYEALPGFLLRLDGNAAGRRVSAFGTPLSLRLSRGGGSYGPRRASVGAGYDFRRTGIEAGADVALPGGALTGSFAAHALKGSADVKSPAGGGRIEAAGLGAAFAASWRAGAWYAEGRAALTRYDVDVSSASRGELASGIVALGHALSLEAGREYALAEALTLTPRAWIQHAGVSFDKFSDRVGARVSLAGGKRFDAGLGVLGEARRAGDWGALSLRASLGLSRTLGGAETAVDVSGERLTSAAGRNRLQLGLGTAWERGGLALAAELSAAGSGSSDRRYSGVLSLKARF